jgi:hypothetical protein
MASIHNDRSLGFAINVAGVAPYPAYAGDGPDPGQVISGTLFDVTQVDSTGLACSPLPAGSATGQIVLVLRGTCTFESKLNNVAAGGALAIVVYDNPGNSIFATGSVTVGQATLPALFVNTADGVDLKARVGQNPALQIAMDFSGASAFPARTDVSDFSSRGPSLGSALKPDLAAVGEEIVTGAQNSYSGGESYSASGFIDTNGTSFSSPLGAGAAAVLKGARPGLTVPQYRSLLINGAAPATASATAPATVSQAGAGILNLLAAVSGTVTAYPTSLNFGTGDAVHATAQLALSNVGTSSDTFTLQAVPAGNAPAPSLATTSISLDPGTSQPIGVTLDATGLAPGEYSGYLLVSGTANPTVARIPYWFAIPGATPAGISVLYQDNSDTQRTLSTQAVVFRVVDAAGLPYTGSLRPAVAVSGTGTVRSLYAAGSIPGTYAVDIRTGTASMQLTFTIGDVTQSVTIPVF